MKLRVLEILSERNKTKYWLYKQMGMSYKIFNKMINNETKSIFFENLEALCQILEYAPNDIFEYNKDLVISK